MDWKKIHRWFESNLQEPLLQAEMHRVDMMLSNRATERVNRLRVIEGGKLRRCSHLEPEIQKKMRQAY
ncbi:hypothetical protein [Desulfallas thermosapovorans]|uniref:Uncharacterized protein n=1 Tax=Desulfallas thermosapovorans DSM 6562 TaxID=1121431 RepID=A0A5S4ZMG3_9FIRM|nr:hypothetical protein [Desulfallas thermosapovorans]TYO92314.1 hypothetical protein LX24_02908 [Desulfallas thermosapovorans DSM 6562]